MFFGLEFLLAIILKFWAILYGLVYGSISSLPMLHRSLLARRLQVEWRDEAWLILFSEAAELHLADVRVFALCQNDAVLIHDRRDEMITPRRTLRIAVPGAPHTLVVSAEMLDLRNGRQTRVFRRVSSHHERSR